MTHTGAFNYKAKKTTTQLLSYDLIRSRLATFFVQKHEIYKFQYRGYLDH